MAEIVDVGEDMSAYGLLVILNRRGVRLRVEASRVHWQATSGQMTVALIRAIKRHEHELVAIIEKGA